MDSGLCVGVGKGVVVGKEVISSKASKEGTVLTLLFEGMVEAEPSPLFSADSLLAYTSIFNVVFFYDTYYNGNQ